MAGAGRTASDWAAGGHASAASVGQTDHCRYPGVAYARIVLVVKKDGPPKARLSCASLWRRRSRLAYLAYRWLDERAFRTSHDAFAQHDTADLLAEAAVVHAAVKETRFCDYVSDTALDQIRDARPDVLLRFGFRILKGPILQAARYGVWSYITATIRSIAVDRRVSGKSCTNTRQPDRCCRSSMRTSTMGGDLPVVREDRSIVGLAQPEQLLLEVRSVCDARASPAR